MGQKEGVGGLFERPTSRGAKLEDRHALMGTVMRPPLRRDLRNPSILEPDLFTQEGILFVEPVVLRRESYPRIDAIGDPCTCIYDGVVGQCDRMEYR